jgi:hypothetical protein
VTTTVSRRVHKVRPPLTRTHYHRTLTSHPVGENQPVRPASLLKDEDVARSSAEHEESRLWSNFSWDWQPEELEEALLWANFRWDWQADELEEALLWASVNSESWDWKSICRGLDEYEPGRLRAHSKD